MEPDIIFLSSFSSIILEIPELGLLCILINGVPLDLLVMVSPFLNMSSVHVVGVLLGLDGVSKLSRPLSSGVFDRKILGVDTIGLVS